MSNEYDALLKTDAPPQQAPQGNEYDALIVDLDKERQTRLRANLTGAQSANPDQTAKAITLSGKTGVPVETIERDVQAVAGPQAVNEYDALIQKSPGLGKWLEDPVNARVAKDDYENLGLIEKGWNEIKRAHLGQKAGVQAIGGSVLGRIESELTELEARDARGEFLTPVERLRLANKGEARKVIGEQGGQTISKLLQYKTEAESIPMRPAMRDMNEAKTWGEAWSAFVSDPLGIVFDLTMQSSPQVAATVAATVAGGPGAGVATMGGLSFGQEFVAGILDNMQELGVDTSDPEALRAAFSNPELMGQVYRKSTIKAAIVGTIDAATMSIAGKTIAPTMIKSTLGKQAANIPAQLAVQMAGGAGGEALGSVAAGNEIKPGAVLAEAAGELGGAPAEIASMKAAGKKVKVAKPVDPETQQAEATAGALDRLIEQTGTTALATRSPEKLQEFLSTVTGEQSVFVPAEVVQAYFQSKPIEDAQRQAEALGISEQLPEALARGGDVVIPLARYVTEANKSDLHAAWREEVRLEVEGLSVRQAKLEAETRDERMKLAVERFEKQLEAGIAEVDATTRVYEDIRDKLTTLGQFTKDAAEQQAALFAERYQARASRNPGSYLDAWDAYQKAGPGTGVDIQTQLSERVGAYPPDELDVLLNSIRSGKEPSRATEQPKETHKLTKGSKFLGYNAEGRPVWERPDGSRQVLRANGVLSQERPLAGGVGVNVRAAEHEVTTPATNTNEQFAKDRTELKAALDSMGIDTGKLTNAQIRRAIKDAVDKKRAGKTFDQPVYHGSPHIFDRFDLSKIGTGEGAQAFGWGLYFAGKREIAKHYRDALTRNVSGVMIDGQPIEGIKGLSRGAKQIAQMVADKTIVLADYIAEQKASIKKNGGSSQLAQANRALAMAALKSAREIEGKTITLDDPIKWSVDGKSVDGWSDAQEIIRKRFVAEARDSGAGTVLSRVLAWAIADMEAGREIDRARYTLPEHADLINRLIDEIEKSVKVDRPGRLYNVEIPNDGAYLHWDKKFGEQSAEVQSALLKMGLREEIARQHKAGLISGNGKIETFTGEEIYGVLREKFYREPPPDPPGTPRGWGFATRGNESSRDASLALRDAGIPGIQYLDAGSRGKGDGTHNYVLFDDSLAKITSFEQDQRGSITFTDNKTIISLFQSRDLSTLIHESGHLFLSELEFDAKAPNAPEQLAKDWQSVLGWLGSKDGYITRDMHEQFARGFETYVMEGKAPSSALASAFRSFKRWLTQIYRRLAALDAPITPEIREVFDRLLATDEQIERVQEKLGLNPVFKDAESAGMTEAEFRAYTERANAVVEQAEQKLLQKTMETIRKQRTAEWKRDEKQVREEVTNEVMADRGQQALALLTKGELPLSGTPEVLKGVKLARESVVELYGDESVLTMLPAGIYRDRASGPGTISPDELAPILALSNGRELIERLMQLEAQKRAMLAKGDKRSVAKAKIDEETAVRMRERFGDPLNDGTIEQEALAAVHSDKQAALMSVELKALAKRAGQTGTVSLDDIRNWAAEAIGQKSVRDGTKFEQYARAEREAGKRVERALMKNNYVEAFKAKQDQLVNHALWMEAKKASDQIEGARKLMDRYAGAETLKGMDQEYLEQIHALLENYEFKPRTEKLLAERKSFEAWAIEQEAKGFEVIAPPRLDKGLFAVNYRDLSIEEMLGLADTVKQIAHLGRWKQEMLDGEKKRAYEAVIAEAVASVQAIPQRGVSQVRRGMTNLQARVGDVASQLRSMDAALLKLETIFEWLDGDKTGRGVFSRVIFRRMSEAQTKERDMQQRLNKQLSDIHDKVPLEQRKRWGEVLVLPELGQSLNRSQLIAVALNIGNASNLDKLLRGEKWNEDAVRQALNKNLTKEEWRFVQDAWDLVDSLWPELEAMESRVHGVAPPKIEPLSVETPFGTLKGGYYPAVYDRDASVDGERISVKQAEGLFDPAYHRGTTRAGSTHKRTEAAYPMLLSLSVIGQHLNEVSHDIAFREAVIDAYRFLSDKRIKEAVNEALGPEYSRQFEPWVKNIANEWAIDRRGLHGWEATLSTLRTNATAVGLGFRLTTMFSQMAGFSNSIQRLGTKGMGEGLRTFLKNPAEQAAFVQERSGEMRHRMNDLERDIRHALKKIEGKSGFVSDVKRFGFKGIALFDYAVSIPTWIGAYNQGLRQGMTDQDAVFYADKMVRDTQSAGAAKDLAAIQRPNSEAWRLLTMFYSYFNVYYNRQRGLVRDARAVESASDVADVMAQSFWLLVVPSLMAPLLTGDGPDEDEDWGTWTTRHIGFGLFSGLPWVRDAANVASRSVGGKGFGGARLSPVQGFWDSAIHTGKDVVRLIEGEDVSPTAVKQLFNTVGYFTGLPTGQAGATSQFVWDVLSGAQNPDGLMEWMSGLAFGPKR